MGGTTAGISPGVRVIVPVSTRARDDGEPTREAPAEMPQLSG